MLLENIFMKFSGYVKIEVEGFFVQRFINLCITNGIFLDKVRHFGKNQISVYINKNDFKQVCYLGKKSSCKIKILKKGGIPFFIHRYRKRKKSFLLILIVLCCFFIMTRFIWNIEINGYESRDKIIEILQENEIELGTKISNIDLDLIVNKIRLKCSDISWVGIKIKGTNLIIDIINAEKKPEIIDETKINNIIANKAGVISKIDVQSGTAKVNVGDEVKEGDVLVEGIMEGKYTGIRYVNSQADILAKVVYSKKDTKNMEEEIIFETGNIENKYSIFFNNFQINLNKSLSKFENYDTIITKRKIRIFSNYYLPIEFEKKTYKETKRKVKSNTLEEITNELKTKLEAQIMKDLNNKYENFIESTSSFETNGNQVTVIVNCIIEEKIGTNQDLVF